VTKPKGTCGNRVDGKYPGVWLFTSTNEDRFFTGGTLHDISPLDPAWTHEFHAQDGGSYLVQLGLDKASPSTVPLDAYSFVGFTHTFDVNVSEPRPTLEEELALQFGFTVLEDMRHIHPQDDVGEAKTRFVVGIVARNPRGGTTYYLEVKLTRSSNFDLCTARDEFSGGASPEGCDESGVYARRARWTGGANGELVTVDIEALSELGLTDAAFQPQMTDRHVRLPVTRLFDAVEWVSEPAEDAEIAGVYIGTEIWGPGRTMMQIDDYELFRQ